MITYYKIFNRFKRSMIEITSETDYKILRKYLDPLRNEKLPDDIKFKVAVGKKSYDIIRLYECGEEFYSQRVIDVLSQFVDMSNKCYPIKIEGILEQYYQIYNLEAYPFLNRKDYESLFIDDPCFWDVHDASLQLFGIKGTSYVIVSEDIKNALLSNKISNIFLVESFGCTKDEYKELKRTMSLPKVRFYSDQGKKRENYIDHTFDSEL